MFQAINLISMKLSQFRFDFPLNLIAQTPTKRREDSRLMVVHKDTGLIENKTFKDILDYFEEKDVFVVNNTKVFPARMYGRKEKTGAKIEVFLLRELNKQNRLWDVIVDPARKIRVGNKLYFGDADELVAEVIDNTTSRGRTIRFLFEGSDDEFKEILNTLGETPLPKYIKRKPDELDRERYQTVYAKHEGAVAAPVALQPERGDGGHDRDAAFGAVRGPGAVGAGVDPADQPLPRSRPGRRSPRLA